MVEIKLVEPLLVSEMGSVRREVRKNALGGEM